MINYLQNKDIDKERWNACINSSQQKMIYGYSWYLDKISPDWDALVLDDYFAVMPLPKREKLGINYIFAPYYAQQLGIFGAEQHEYLTREFIDTIPDRYRLIDIRLNESNLLPGNYKYSQMKVNYLLDISPDYSAIRNNYNRNCKRNIKKAIDNGLQVGESINAKEFGVFIQKNLQDQIDHLSAADINLLEVVTQESMNRKQGEIVCVRDQNGEINAAGSFLFMPDRIIFSVCASTPIGKQSQAMYLLVDHQIRKSAGNYGVFDFSGSEIKGIAYFNSTFGAKIHHYPFIHINRLNWIQRILSGKIN